MLERMSRCAHRIRSLVPSAGDTCGNFQGWAALWVSVPYKRSSVALCSLRSRTLWSNTATPPQAALQSNAVLLESRDPCCLPASPCQAWLAEVTSRP